MFSTPDPPRVVTAMEMRVDASKLIGVPSSVFTIDSDAVVSWIILAIALIFGPYALCPPNIVLANMSKYH